MANFLQDNPDLQFYLNEWIDWEALYEITELRSPEADPDAPVNAEEAADSWREVLDAVGDFAANEIA